MTDELNETESAPPPAPAEGKWRSISRRRWILGCAGIWVLIVGIYLVIGLVAAYQGLQDRKILNDQEAAAHLDKGRSQLAAGNIELALAEIQLALRLNPDSAEAKTAWQEAKNVAAKNPTPVSETTQKAADGLIKQAETALEARNWKSAIDLLTQARGINPQYDQARVSAFLFNAYFSIGDEAVKANDPKAALGAYELALAERPTDQNALNQRHKASLYVSAKEIEGLDWAKVVDLYQELYKLDSGFLDVRQRLLSAYKALAGKYSIEKAWCLAERQYTQAMALSSDSEIIQLQGDAAFRCKESASQTPTPEEEATAETGSVISGTAKSAAKLSLSGSLILSAPNTTDGSWEIVVQDGGGQMRPLAALATQPALSPDGGSLAYHSENPSSEGLHAINLTTGEDVRTTTYREDALPRWSPDNRRLIFASQRDGDRQWRIMLTWADGKSPAQELGPGQTPDWSPDGKSIVYFSTDAQGNNAGLYIREVDSGKVQQLTQHQSDRAPAWSPDGKQVAYMSTQNGSWDLFIVTVATGKVESLFSSPGNDGLPAWSPDGKQLAFVSDKDGSWGIYVLKPKGGDVQRAADWTGHPDWLTEQICWGR